MPAGTPAPVPEAWRRERLKARIKERQIALALAALGALAIVALTAIPSSGMEAEDVTPWCIACGYLGGVDFALNVLLYVPFGLGLGAMRFRMRSAMAAVFVTSLAVELLQIGVINGRDATLGDLMANTMGGLIGIWIGSRWRSLVYPRASESLRLAGIWGLLWLGLVAASTWAVGVDIPEPPWWAQLALKDHEPETFRGRVLETSIGGITVRSDSVENSAAVRGALLDGAPATVKAVIPGPSGMRSIMFVIADSTEVPIFTVAQDGHDGVFQVRTRAGTVLGLQGPSIRLPGAFRATPGDTVMLTGQQTRRFISITAQQGGARVTRTVKVSPNWSWSFFLPFEYTVGPGSWRATAVWIALLILPLGYWLGRAAGLGAAAGSGTVLMTLIPTSFAVIGLWAIPRLGGLDPSDWIEWCAWVLGAAIGVATALVSARCPMRLSDVTDSDIESDVTDLHGAPNWRPTRELI